MTEEKIDWQERIGFQRVIRRGPLVVVCGTGPIAPDGGIAAPGDAYGQAKRCFEVICEALRTVDAELSDVIRTRMTLAKADDWEAVGRAHGEIFRDIRPVTTMTGGQLVDSAFLVEIDVTAWVTGDDGSGPTATREHGA